MEEEEGKVLVLLPVEDGGGEHSIAATIHPLEAETQ